MADPNVSGADYMHTLLIYVHHMYLYKYGMCPIVRPEGRTYDTKHSAATYTKRSAPTYPKHAILQHPSAPAKFRRKFCLCLYLD